MAGYLSQASGYGLSPSESRAQPSSDHVSSMYCRRADIGMLAPVFLVPGGLLRMRLPPRAPSRGSSGDHDHVNDLGEAAIYTRVISDAK